MIFRYNQYHFLMKEQASQLRLAKVTKHWDIHLCQALFQTSLDSWASVLFSNVIMLETKKHETNVS